MVPTTTGTTTTPTVFAPLRLICETSRHLPKAVQQPKETVSRHLPMQASDKYIPLRRAIPAGMQPATAAANQRRAILTYEELCSFEVLYKAYLEARKGKRSKSKTIEYEAQALAWTE